MFRILSDTRKIGQNDCAFFLCACFVSQKKGKERKIRGKEIFAVLFFTFDASLMLSTSFLCLCSVDFFHHCYAFFLVYFLKKIGEERNF